MTSTNDNIVSMLTACQAQDPEIPAHYHRTELVGPAIRLGIMGRVRRESVPASRSEKLRL